jgi:aminopeptidase N
MPLLPFVLLLHVALPVQSSDSDPGASGGVLLPEQAAYDVLHYGLTLEVDPEQKRIDGELVMRAQLVEAEAQRILLDLDDRLKVERVSLNGAPVEFDRGDGRIGMAIDAEVLGDDRIFEVAVTYGGVPREAPRPPWKGGFTWSQSASGKPWISTTCQGEGADLWWPCKDHPSDKPETMDLAITVPGGLFCASNGTLVSNELNEDGSRTIRWHVANPISNYNVALNIGEYTLIERTYESTTGEEVPFHIWVLPENAIAARAAAPYFEKHTRFYEEVCGPYPFRNEKLGLVETPHLGMEHQSIIAYGNRFRADEDGYDWLHHHELGHEWWGNLVTCRDWKDMWIHEGICTYMQVLYLERTRGKQGMQAKLDSMRRGLKNRRPVAPRDSRDSKQIYFDTDGGSDNDIYDKGAWVVHQLRWLLGDEVFFRTLRRMAYPDPALEAATDGSQVRFTDTSEIRAIAERESGLDLGWFFDLYLRQPALPILDAQVEGGTLELSWSSPEGTRCLMPVPVSIGGVVRRVEMPDGTANVELDGAEWELDPDGWLLRESAN